MPLLLIFEASCLVFSGSVKCPDPKPLARMLNMGSRYFCLEGLWGCIWERIQKQTGPDGRKAPLASSKRSAWDSIICAKCDSYLSFL